MNLGFIGLGDIGSLIVPRLMVAGHTVTGWNRTKAKAEPLIASGMKWADTPRAATAASQVVFSCLTDGNAVKSCALGPDGILAGLASDGVYIDMSTISPDVTREVASATTLAAVGDRMRAGDVVICGSIVPPLFLDSNDAQVVYRLDPIGEISVRFSHA